jgi:hypothetical protein
MATEELYMYIVFTNELKRRNGFRMSTGSDWSVACSTIQLNNDDKMHREAGKLHLYKEFCSS